MQKMKCKLFTLGMLVMLGISLTGCGAKNKNENINAGMDLVESLSYEESLTYFEQALLNGEDKELTYRGEALAYMGMTMYDEAIECFLKAFSYCDGRTGSLEMDMNYYLATSYTKVEKHAEAEDIYTSILALQPKTEDALFLRGVSRLKQGNKDGAVQDFETTLALDQNDIELLVDVYQALTDAGFEEDGKVYLQNMIEQKGDGITDYEQGVLSYYLEDYETARIHLEATSASGTDAKITMLLGKTYEALGDLNYAVVVYSSFLDKNEADAEILNQLGMCRMKLQNYEEALDAFEQGIAIEQNSMMQTLKFNEIVANEYLGEFATAKTLMSSYLTTYPDDEAAVREASFLETR